jgi:serine/threonine protein kinase
MSQPDPPVAAPALAAEGQIDEACDRFEAQWRAGRRPRIEDFLGGQAGAGQARLLYELLRLELEYRGKAGEQPARQEYRDRFPDQGAVLDRLFGGDGGTPPADGPASTVTHERPDALKCIRTERLSPGALGRFRREGQALARLSHPHIVGVFGWAEHPEAPALVLEYVPGGSLEGRLPRGKPLDPAEAARLVAALARAASPDTKRPPGGP